MKTFLTFLITCSLGFAHEFPEIYNSEKGNPISPEKAAASFKVPEGFEVTVFAAEPDVQNPIAMAWDDKGRMWVAENYTFAEKKKRFDLNLRDRIIIFEDADRDGKAEKRTIFSDQLQMLTSIEVQPGGIWAMCPPHLLFIPDANGDDIPDSEPEVILDGFTVAKNNYHNFANGLRWGPDGWLYGRCGGSCPGKVGAPGTPEAERVPLEGGIWRYHPKRKFFEVILHGTTNPWGHDWDKNGEGFFINTVNGHLWHMIPGGHFDRPFGRSKNDLVYEAIQMHADHWHFDTKGTWQKSRYGAANDFGGGHSHIGMCIYQGDHLPKNWQGKLLTWNQHGRRINVERLERKGSGYLARHEPDQFLSGDDWFRGLDIREGPDGALFALDWSDTGECHDHTGVHRTSGRIYRFSHGKIDRSKIAKLSPLQTLLKKHRAKPIAKNELLALLNHSDEHHRVWAIRLLTDTWPLDSVHGPMPHRKPPSDPELRKKFVAMAKSDPSGLVRLALASTLQRMPVKDRAVLASALASRAEDADDHNLPKLVWFGIMKIGEDKLKVPRHAKWPDLLRYLARSSTNDPKMVNAIVSLASSEESKSKHLLTGLLEGFKGRQKAPMPPAWKTATFEKHHPKLSRELSALFGDGRALDSLRAIVLDKKEELPARRQALQSLIDAKVGDLRPLCEKLFKSGQLRQIAVRGLAGFDDPALGKMLTANYQKIYQVEEKAAVIDALVTRPNWAASLLAEMKKGSIPRAAITPFQARQILAMNNEKLTQSLRKIWGEIRKSDKALEKKIAHLQKTLTPQARAKGNKSKGRVHFQILCASCHQLYGQGGKLGPDLTGSGRADLGYLLENIIAPNSVVPTEYQMSIITLKDQRVLSGVIAASNDRTITLQTLINEEVIEKSNIAKTTRLTDSMMPPGLIDALSPEEIRDLIAYLMHPQQVALPK